MVIYKIRDAHTFIDRYIHTYIHTYIRTYTHTIHVFAHNIKFNNVTSIIKRKYHSCLGFYYVQNLHKSGK